MIALTQLSLCNGGFKLSSLRNKSIHQVLSVVVPIILFKKGNPSIYIDDPDLLDENSSKEPEQKEGEDEEDEVDEEDKEEAAKHRVRHQDNEYK